MIAAWKRRKTRPTCNPSPSLQEPGTPGYTRTRRHSGCAGFGVWNYLIQIALEMSAPCLAVGNCMVYKVCEVTPLHGHLLAQIYSEAGVPPGVFNVVHRDGAVDACLTAPLYCQSLLHWPSVDRAMGRCPRPSSSMAASSRLLFLHRTRPDSRFSPPPSHTVPIA